MEGVDGAAWTATAYIWLVTCGATEVLERLSLIDIL